MPTVTYEEVGTVPIRVSDDDVPAIELPDDASPFERLIYYNLFGYWIKSTGKRFPGVMERIGKIEWVLKWAFVGFFILLLIPAAKALGIPTDKLGEFILHMIGA